MHPRALAAREQMARERLVSASQSLAAGLGMTELADAIVHAHHKEPKIAALRRDEAVADFVAALAESLRVIGPALTEESVLERLEGLDLSKTSMAKIRKEFGAEPKDDDEDEDEDGQGDRGEDAGEDAGSDSQPASEPAGESAKPTGE